MCKIKIIEEYHCDLTGFVTGVLATVDNGDTQYMTVGEYTKLIEKRKEKYGERETTYLGKG